MSSSRLWVRISNCSRDFLSVCGERSTQYLLILVGSGIGPAILAPVRLAVSTISPADWSSSLWSYALRRMRMRGVVMAILDYFLAGAAAGTGVPAALAGLAAASARIFVTTPAP